MNKLKIFGWDNPISVFPNIKQEFVNQGWTLVDDGPADLIFHTTGFFDQAIDYYHNYPTGVKIFNLLDANPLDPRWPSLRVATELGQADIVTTISETAKKQITIRTGVSNIEVIGYPMLPTIEDLNFLKGIDFLWVGRIVGAKRFSLALNTLRLMGVDTNLLAVAGPEKPPCGVYVGVLDAKTLNELYNSSKFVFLTSQVEGLGLTAMEACVTGGFPIVCKDNPAVYELGLEEFAADPNPESLALKINEIITNPQKYWDISKPLGKRFKEQFSVKTFVQNVLNLYNQYYE